MTPTSLAELRALRHRYVGLRHGESEANVAGLVVSDPAVGVGGYGLTARGRDQVRVAVAAAALPAPLRILSSDFARAWETAEVAQAVLGGPEVEPAVALRERTFGRWEGGGNDAYGVVWAADARDAGHREGGVESVCAVAARLTGLVLALEAAPGPASTILLVSHGDPLQILQTALLGAPLGTHRARPPWENGELRPLVLGAQRP